MLCGDAMSRVELDQLDPSWGTFSLGSLGDVAFATREMLANVCDNNLPTLVLARCCVDIINSALMNVYSHPRPSHVCTNEPPFWIALHLLFGRCCTHVSPCFGGKTSSPLVSRKLVPIPILTFCSIDGQKLFEIETLRVEISVQAEDLRPEYDLLCNASPRTQALQHALKNARN